MERQTDRFLQETAILFLDSRSTQHTSVQDGRLLRTFKDWLEEQEYSSNFIELPLFHSILN